MGKALAGLLAALLLTGCAYCRQHERRCNAVILGAGVVLIGTLAGTRYHGGGCTCGCPGTPRCH